MSAIKKSARGQRASFYRNQMILLRQALVATTKQLKTERRLGAKLASLAGAVFVQGKVLTSIHAGERPTLNSLVVTSSLNDLGEAATAYTDRKKSVHASKPANHVGALDDCAGDLAEMEALEDQRAAINRRRKKK